MSGDLAEVVEQIDDSALRSAAAFIARNVMARKDPVNQARQLQSLAITLATLGAQYGVGEEQLVRVLRAACCRVADARGCTTAEVVEA